VIIIACNGVLLTHPGVKRGYELSSHYAIATNYAATTSSEILEIFVLLDLSLLDLSAKALIMLPSGIKSPIEPQE
jgi:hypothetical protein